MNWYNGITDNGSVIYYTNDIDSTSLQHRRGHDSDLQNIKWNQ